MSRFNIYAFREVFRESLFLFSQKTTILNSASQRSTTVTFMKPSTFFGLNLYRNFNLKSYLNARECLNSCAKCIRQWSDQNVLRFLLVKHFNSIANQRIRRSSQMFGQCRNLGFDRHYFRCFIEKWLKSFNRRDWKNTWYFMLGSTIFAWDEDKVSDSELDRVSEDIEVKKFKKESNPEWELIVNKDDVLIWRKSIPCSGLYKYRVSGTYKDISARSFFHTQVDLDFRRQWDKHVISLNVIDKDDCSGSEVVHWITEFPYPMCSREYVYVRRHKIDNEKRLMVIISRGIPHHPAVPVSNDHVRVTDYCSEMVIKPHTNFDENGFDYILTYFDDPKSSIPKVALSWAASSGIPDFVDKLYNATVMLQHKKKLLNELKNECFKNEPLKNIEKPHDENKLPM